LPPKWLLKWLRFFETLTAKLNLSGVNVTKELNLFEQKVAENYPKERSNRAWWQEKRRFYIEIYAILRASARLKRLRKRASSRGKKRAWAEALNYSVAFTA
jgi:hypothetical protein